MNDKIPELSGNANNEDDLLWHALNYRGAGITQAEDAWKELEQYVTRIRDAGIRYGMILAVDELQAAVINGELPSCCEDAYDWLAKNDAAIRAKAADGLK